MGNETTDVVILQLKIDEGTGKKMPEAKKEVEVLAGSIVGLTRANKQLREERNRLDASTVEGAKKIQELNKLIDQNNDLIKQNSSNLEKQRMNVGNYKRGVIDALKELRIGGVNVGEVMDKLSKANEDLFQGMIQGYQKSGIAAKLFGNTARTALTLTGIGVIIAGLTVIIAYWDDISDAIGLTDKKFQEHMDHATARSAELNTLLEKRLALMKAAGVSEIEQLDLQINSLRDEIAAHKQIQADITKQASEDVIKRLGKRAEQYANETKTIQDLNDKLNVLILTRDKLAKEEERTSDEAATKRAENEAKERQAEIDREAKKFAEDLKRKKEEQQFISDELRAIDAEEFERREAEKRVSGDEWLRKDLEAQRSHLADVGAINEGAIKKQLELEAKAAKKAVEIDRLKNEALVGGVELITKEKSSARVLLNSLFRADAIKETFTNTYAAAVAAFKSLATIPIVGPALGAVAAATVTAFGLSNVAKISGITFAKDGEFKPKKYAYGGLLVGGRSHAEGGTTYTGEDGNRFEVEKGEGIYILKKTAQDKINYLSSLNVANGGRSWSSKTWYAAQGGQIESRVVVSNVSVDTAGMQKALINALQHIDFFVRVDDINNAQQTGAAVKARARVV